MTKERERERERAGQSEKRQKGRSFKKVGRERTQTSK